MESVITGVVTFCVGLIVGLIIGYYRSRAEHTKELSDSREDHNRELNELREDLHAKTSKDDCMQCDLRKVVAGLTGELKEGSDTFRRIQQDIGAIRTSIALLQQAHEKQSM